ncbi:MAG: PAS domain S-box protein [Acidobacteriaceae bacterium]|nr:PAS domain S-box protein [Acidobacteriaceae bacterium]
MESEAANSVGRSTTTVTSASQSRIPAAPHIKRGLSHENRLLLLALGSGALPVLVSIIFLWTGDHDPNVRWSLTSILVIIWVGFAFAVRSGVVRPLQTLANMQSALREGDFSFRVRGAKSGDALGELMLEVNTLSEMLREQRLGAMEASALLTTVMTEIDVAVFAFDGERRLRLVNRAGERVMGQNAERLLGKSAAELDLLECLEGESARTLEKNFPGQSGRWGFRRSVFRQHGKPHYLLVLADLSRALREEERQAWQRLVRVLGHELNNSLAPICSIAASLEDIMKRQARASDWEDDLRRGLRVIHERSDALSRFMRDYSRLTRLPKPQLRPTDLGTLIRTAAGLETRALVEIEPGPEITLNIDPDQLQQVLINLIRNAVDASLDTGGNVKVGWSKNGSWITLLIQDEGPGIANPGNLFVPFFTTKPAGSGIGLVLSRQIAEAHGGSLSLRNRAHDKGCEAIIQLPVTS